MRASCSRASVALLEAGYEPKRSEVLKRVQSTLHLLETPNGDDPAGTGSTRREFRGADASSPTP